MNEVIVAVAIIVLSSFLPCSVLAWLIGVKQKRELLSGYDESKIKNPEAWGKILAIGIFSMGCLISLTAIIWGLGGFTLTEFIVALTLASFSLLPFVVYANSKYK